jgi:drug/metabolite transporter (DMT)-like permease
MPEKDRIDLFGAATLTGFALLLAFNQVIIKLSAEGLQPVFMAGLRSVGAAICVYLWMRARGIAVQVPRHTVPAGFLAGGLFALEFILLFKALDLTTVVRFSVIFYTMPVWLALAAHVLLPGQKITGMKGAGLTLAFAGVVIAIVMRGGGGEASLLGDLLALGASISWAAIAICMRATAMKEVRPETQLLWQLVLSAPLLLVASLAFGPLLRDPTLWHWAGLGFQIVAVASAGFLLWLWLLSIYPAAAVAAFSFLSPVFGVILGWLLLGEAISWPIVVALGLVVAGLILINRPARAPVQICTER